MECQISDLAKQLQEPLSRRSTTTSSRLRPIRSRRLSVKLSVS